MEKNYLLHKYLNGEASEEDIQKLMTDPEMKDYLKIATETSKLDAPNYEANTNWEAITKKTLSHEPKVRKLNPVKQLWRVAAVVAILIAGYFFLLPKNTVVSTDIAQQQSFQLPDTSEVVLNASSEISYHKKNWGEQRNLELDGEAYFKVAKGKKFSVETPQGVVSVLGTQFNVYSRGDEFQIKTFEGLVSVAFNDTLVKVPAGNFLKVTKNELASFTMISEHEPSWVNFESSFSNEPLVIVFEELERQYPIKVTTEIPLTQKFTGSFTHKNLDIALRSICEPLQLQFTIQENQVSVYANQ